MYVEKKMIKIVSRGPINEIGGVYGPILSPYMEKVKTIAEMLKNGKKITEVLLDKKEVELNMENYNIDHNQPSQPSKPVKKEQKIVAPEPIKPVEEVKEEVKVEEVKEEVKQEEVVETEVSEEKKEEDSSEQKEESKNNFDSHFRYNKHKHKK